MGTLLTFLLIAAAFVAILLLAKRKTNFQATPPANDPPAESKPTPLSKDKNQKDTIEPV